MTQRYLRYLSTQKKKNLEDALESSESEFCEGESMIKKKFWGIDDKFALEN